jgi:type II secretory pathway pseudopilin PulG
MSASYLSRASRDSGFGMVEVVVSLFLLGVMAIAILPVMISTLRLSSSNISLTTATQLVSEQMDVARGLAPTCAALQTWAAERNGLLVTDPRGAVLEIHRQVPATCPTAYPSALKFTSWVTVDGAAAKVATGETRIRLASAN